MNIGYESRIQSAIENKEELSFEKNVIDESKKLINEMKNRKGLPWVVEREGKPVIKHVDNAFKKSIEVRFSQIFGLRPDEIIAKEFIYSLKNIELEKLASKMQKSLFVLDAENVSWRFAQRK